MSVNITNILYYILLVNVFSKCYLSPIELDQLDVHSINSESTEYEQPNSIQNQTNFHNLYNTEVKATADSVSTTESPPLLDNFTRIFGKDANPRTLEEVSLPTTVSSVLNFTTVIDLTNNTNIIGEISSAAIGSLSGSGLGK
ncbi:hypothetical protein RN001_008623 [Aquatica leii]|uniref:Uncharacterized protein n=1 Tax=Aquatica leii TaxID=1421715 RepID=A0AAN7PZB2_9COLE|nr:hypothetical protein RN001_008623 [Aquatica leii]